MDTQLGLRERKKRDTRRRLVEAAVRLFAEQGYEQTTTAQIAAAAEVSPRTFFSYFDTKEDVVFGMAEERGAHGIQALADRRGDEGPLDALLRTYNEMWVQAWQPDIDEYRQRGLQLVQTVPALRARGLLKFFEWCEQMTDALHEAYPDELDLTEAAAMVGSIAGAMQVAALEAGRRGGTPEELATAVERAAQLALAGWSTNDGDAPLNNG